MSDQAHPSSENMIMHTPGPWHLTLPGFKEADRKLIHAAPEMLEALKGVSIMLNCLLKEYSNEPWALSVREAINKATL